MNQPPQQPPPGGWGQPQPPSQPNPGAQPGYGQPPQQGGGFGQPAPGGAPLAQTASEPTQDEKMWAAIAHASNSFLFLLGPAVVYFMKKDESQFVAYHALQSLYGAIAGAIVTTITCGFGSLAYLAFALFGAWKAWQGEWYEFPVIGKYASQKPPPPGAGGAPASF